MTEIVLVCRDDYTGKLEHIYQLPLGYTIPNNRYSIIAIPDTSSFSRFLVINN